MHGRSDPVPIAPSLGRLLTHTAAAHPSARAAAHGGASLSYAELSAAVDRLAAALAVEPGERVVIVAPNAPALVCAMFAAWRVGAVAVPVGVRARRFELQRVLVDARPAAVVSVERHAGFEVAREIRSLAQDSPTLRRCLIVDDLGEVVQAAGVASEQAAEPSDPGLAAVLYTSGTTGEPKGALVSHAMAVAMGENLAELLGDDAGAPYGLAAPASHAFGLGCLLAGVVAGAGAVLVEVASSIEPMAEALAAQAARLLHGTPALLSRVRRLQSRLRLRGGLVAGSWCPPELLSELDAQGMRVLNLYGMTEIGAAVSCRFGDPPDTRYHTVGRPLAGYEVRVTAPEDGADAGEIQVRSGLLARGYLGRPWTETELADGEWFRTGDLGRLDSAGNLTIAGRAKEVVHVGGFNVFPAEVESFLLTHPSILQAAVVGTPHPALGEALRAFVVPAPGSELAPRDVVSFARGGIAGYKVPYTVELLDELPALPSGKPDRRALAEASAERAEEAVRR